MPNKFKYFFVFSAVFLSSLLLVATAEAATLAAQLSGRILLQVESRGEAWYVNPNDYKRYFLGKPDDAFSLMRTLSLGISETEFAAWSNGAPTWARGRLYIRPQSHGEAYYVDLNRRWHYLGRPLDAWLLFRSQGLGITNTDLAKIPLALNTSVTTNLTPSDYASSLSWIYKLQNFKLVLPLKTSLYYSYTVATKNFYYTGDVEPANAREQFYAIFFNKKSGDTAVKDLVAYGRSEAIANSWTKDQTAEFLISLVQYIAYDNAKLNQNPLQPNYPYETLYKNKGICSDKTFLTIAILRDLGYGAAILDFPALNHSAAGISCPLSDSVNNSGYCYVETTNYFPVGVIPQAISGGQAITSGDSLSGLFDSSHLSKMEIYQKTSGLSYNGVAATKNIVANLEADKLWIETQKTSMLQKNSLLSNQQSTLSAQQTQLAAYSASGDISAYNNLVGLYNTGVNQYNADLEVYRGELAIYNSRVNQYNEGLKSFYQK